ncbi:diguanylate cyclase (GGDEF) domain-containing protein [Alkalibacterium subtropicum]|uniref:Diguanylate cyclase (GGDEF) domain-containing protein n=1 Tax=Alkalibacterium subtropicum TaxID=753702 RepID=A0A1I1KAZ7_9LACT|nr:diguanylate cyclase [Alkalibacterium subtropicum]SFC57502.1 diguanylate cyclase (GGDEF) domain-containing protein [Alkalibacterium subtropicum]
MKKWAISFLIAALAALLLYIPVNDLHIEYNNQLYEEQRADASEHLNMIRDDIQARLDSSLFYADFFEMIVSQDPDISESELREYGAFIVGRNPLVDSISLAKDGIIHFVYPLEGNEESLGYNLLEDPDRKLYLEEAIDKRKAVAQGPVKTIQGGRKIFNRKPVFIEKISTEEVWGFANVIIDFDNLVEASLLPNQSHAFDYAIKVESKWVESTSWGDESVFEEDAVTASILLPENEWTIALIPSNGWNRTHTIHSVETIVFYFFILIIFILVMFFVLQYLKKRELSRTDALTRLLNKKTFEVSVKRVLKRSSRNNGLLLIDFNDFKRINDTHGHLVGDQVLTITAERLMHCLKKGDLIGRIGGDEMMILVKDIDAATLESIKERVIRHIEKPIVLNKHMINPSISVGQTLVSQWLPFDHLYDIVDKKMYRDKTVKKSRKAQLSISFDLPDLES